MAQQMDQQEAKRGDAGRLMWICGVAVQPFAAWRVVEADIDGTVALCAFATVLLLGSVLHGRLTKEKAAPQVGRRAEA